MTEYQVGDQVRTLIAFDTVYGQHAEVGEVGEVIAVSIFGPMVRLGNNSSPYGSLGNGWAFTNDELEKVEA